jgi:hypothetical protein
MPDPSRPLPPALDRLLERFARGEAVRRPTAAHPDCTCGRVDCAGCGHRRMEGYGQPCPRCDGIPIRKPKPCTLEH